MPLCGAVTKLTARIAGLGDCTLDLSSRCSEREKESERERGVPLLEGGERKEKLAKIEGESEWVATRRVRRRGFWDKGIVGGRGKQANPSSPTAGVEKEWVVPASFFTA